MFRPVHHLRILLFATYRLPAPLARLRRSPRAPAGRRGFTLIELVVVVVIIGTLAALAMPAISGQMRDRRAQQAAQDVATLYRNARTRALARGAAVLVRFDGGVDSGGGRIEVRESIQAAEAADADANCAPLPGAGCNSTLWGAADATNQMLTSLEPGLRGEYENVVVSMAASIGGAPAATPQLDVCFSSVGSAFIRAASSGAFSRMTGVAVATVGRRHDGTPLGLQREVVIPPNGAARLGL
jgi:prepilin-type N-terminal cleavage/methylation domain-containing protein